MASTRRVWLQRSLALAPLMARGKEAKVSYAYVGCYTTAERHARGDGIHVYRMDPETGAWSHVQHVGNLVNPSFLVLSRDQRFLYSVHGDENYATSFAVDAASGQLTKLNRASTGGTNGVSQAIDPSGRFMIVANYGSGTVAVLPIRSDGALSDQTQLVKLEGKPGPHRTEQASSHPHHVIFDPSGRYVVVPDKGLDRVFVFRFETGRLTATAQGSEIVRPGYGPRHAAFHPTLPVLWVLNEMSSQVETFAWDPKSGFLRAVEILPSLPSDYTGNSSLAEIAVSPDGRFVYASNRGHDSVAIFAADAKTGRLKPAGWAPSRGRTPRYIGLDPTNRFLYACNEQSDTVVTLRVDRGTGGLTPTGQVIKNASPVTIAFTRG